ncbi:MAG: hypothetical protein KDE20_01715 [Caldilineaceae bacterium]|nr:hypothetical protein [Caldilineaceae bacterium]
MMNNISRDKLIGIVVDIETELGHLDRLAADIQDVQLEIAMDPEHRRLFYENLALKLHNFYTGCERIFNVVTSELNGGPPTGYDWHQRLLDRMAADWGERPAIITAATATDLREFLSFRHVVRNVYGYELDPERIERLLEKYPQTWTAFRSDVENFIRQLKTMADLV